ncbi:dephospho-CoA kinase [Dethiosulfovibrio sp. F2B]|uniref:dephospho-CoA kinase n=1 Tax=Dethiosulfovibrio faecalis TaxID=2720018 RepID=UPI001EEBD5FA|nr:dephospho-CoA kinase [Dethiosulfovibrio faecalis]MCF4150270.1 dephospho-CoA kinase [Dethiosulfovibrio faecalis]
MFVLGITGDIGAGKSTVASILGNMGARVIDADQIVRRLWNHRELVDAARDRWGDTVLNEDGKISPSAVAERFFGEETEYRWLCRLIHPMVRSEMASGLSAERGWVVVEIPLLFESDVPYWCDMTLYVTASPENRVARNSLRGLNGDELDRREKFLTPSEKKKSMADLVISNDGSLDELKEILKSHGEKMLRMSSICTVKIQCAFKKQAKQLISGILGKKLAYQANLASLETAYSRYDQFLTDNWEVQFYTLAPLVPEISRVASEIMKKEPTPLAVADVLRASLSFREALCEACL